MPKRYNTPHPVSYTHLDVYKRQAPALGGRPAEPLAGAEGAAFGGTERRAVSYTHLDVYKRQAM